MRSTLFDQVVVGFEEAVVYEVVTLDSRQRNRHLRFCKFVDQFLIGK